MSETLVELSRKERDVLSQIAPGISLGHNGNSWVLMKESRQGKFPKREITHLNYKICDKMLEKGLIRRNGTFNAPCETTYDRFVLTDTAQTALSIQ